MRASSQAASSRCRSGPPTTRQACHRLAIVRSQREGCLARGGRFRPAVDDHSRRCVVARHVRDDSGRSPEELPRSGQRFVEDLR